MTDPLFWHRLQFGFTITYHYLFPQLTMGQQEYVAQALEACRLAASVGQAAFRVAYQLVVLAACRLA